jgi:DnaJ-class molecular chaperone
MSTDSVLTLVNEGLPKVRRATAARTGERGHLYVVVQVQMPQTVTSQQRELIEKAFGAPKREKVAEGAVVTGNVLPMSFTDLTKAKTAEWADGAGGASHGHPGAGRAGPGGQQAQCQAQ